MGKKKKKVLGGLKCACGWGDECKKLLIAHVEDPSAARINGKLSPFITITRPEEVKEGRNKTQAVFKEQIFKRVCTLCN